jgi:hypothetical protein
MVSLSADAKISEDDSELKSCQMIPFKSQQSVVGVGIALKELWSVLLH